ncbi:MAG: methylated-DNA--[protein]-cysteine S-methyltransferase [Bryobacteraceae bacterium]
MLDAHRFFIDRTHTPIGRLLIVCDGEGRLLAIDWEDHEFRMKELLGRYYPEGFHLFPAENPSGLTAALNAYMAGDISAIECLPVEAAGTPFQRTVWKALRSIPAGETITYTQLAQRVGKPAAVRAAGAANGANPVSIVVPCHRVIGSNSALTGYGGGLERKRWLLNHEASYARLTRTVYDS